MEKKVDGFSFDFNLVLYIFSLETLEMMNLASTFLQRSHYYLWIIIEHIKILQKIVQNKDLFLTKKC